MYIVIVYISVISPPFLVLNLTIYVFKKERYFRNLLDSVIMIFFLLLLLKRDILFLKRNVIPKFYNNQNLNKKSCLPKLGNHKKSSPFLGSHKNQPPKTQPGTANLRSAELWRDWNFAGWGWDPRWPRLDSPQRQCLGGLFTGTLSGQTLTRNQFPQLEYVYLRQEKNLLPPTNMCFITSDKNTQYLARKTWNM